MSKELTEQWRNGTLPEGWYYLKVKSELANYPVIAECVTTFNCQDVYSYFYDYDDCSIEEVLAPVPSYQENQQLKELLKECREFFYENLIGTEFHFSYGLGSDIKKQSCIRSLSKLKTRIDNAIGEKK